MTLLGLVVKLVVKTVASVVVDAVEKHINRPPTVPPAPLPDTLAGLDEAVERLPRKPLPFPYRGSCCDVPSCSFCRGEGL